MRGNAADGEQSAAPLHSDDDFWMGKETGTVR